MLGGLLADLVVNFNMSHHPISTVASRFIRSGTSDRVVAPPSDDYAFGCRVRRELLSTMAATTGKVAVAKPARAGLLSPQKHWGRYSRSALGI